MQLNIFSRQNDAKPAGPPPVTVQLTRVPSATASRAARIRDAREILCDLVLEDECSPDRHSLPDSVAYALSGVALELYRLAGIQEMWEREIDRLANPFVR